ncbi:membrane protein [Algimonas arctica]|uniref:Methylamine utilization protein MauE n=1 Tax=Algimonas arctica TaxID=1479486 RepID=A0A8J3CSS7_9PROT|nr:MauE/DoxX family redox-associated membrane protein [Algimonas arctica]GHA94031.1 membrane protein [Algimonas arctica]
MTTSGEFAVNKTGEGRKAIVYRMVTSEHICPFGLKTVDLLKRKGFEIEDNHLENRPQTDAFKEKWNVKTTPQTFIGGERIGGFDDVRRHFGYTVKDPNEKTYTPVVVVFIIAALMALAAVWALTGDWVTGRTVEWFIAFSMAMLAMLKLRDLDSFSNMFLNYDVLARRVVRYAYVYPFAEAFTAVMMIAGGVFGLIAAPVALFVGTIGAWSVFKAVYIDKRELKCACVGGGVNVPLGFVSLSENLAMMGMGIWMIIKAVI